MRTENESSLIVDGKVSHPKRVDKQLVRIKKELERFEGIVDNLKMFLRMKPKERKLVSGIIDMWLDKIK
jgi:hypothetical protein